MNQPQNRSTKKASKLAVLFVASFVILAGFSLVAEEVHIKKSPPDRHDTTLVKNLKDSDLQQRQYMIEISRQLGVTCTYCHDLKDFKKADKAAYKISKNHIDVVKTLNDKYSSQVGVKVDCYMCHRGQVKPDYKEKVQGEAH